MPLLSVFLPNYNHEKYLRQSIESILVQSFKDFELIIVDDGSTDKSWEIISEYAKKDSRIIAERFTENRGVLRACGRCLELCQGTFILGRASDDYICNPDFFAEAMQAVALYPNAAGVFAGCKLENDSTGEMFGEMGYYKAEENSQDLFSFIPKEKACKDFITNRLFVPGASSIWKRQLIQQAGGFHKELGPQIDYFLNHLLSMLHGVVVLHNCSVTVRASPNSYSARASNNDYFRRHALVEKKIRAQIPQAAHDENWKIWRQAVIDYKIPSYTTSKWIHSQILGRIVSKIHRGLRRYKKWRAHVLMRTIVEES